MNRRGFLVGLGVSIAAPAIVRASNLMSISVLPPIANKTDIELWNEAMQWATQQPKRRVAADRLATLAQRYGPTPEEVAREEASRAEFIAARKYSEERLGAIDYDAVCVPTNEPPKFGRYARAA